MKVSFRILEVFLLTILSLSAGSESLPPQENSVSAASVAETAPPTLKITNAKYRTDGSIEFHVDSPNSFTVRIESSPDLAQWIGEGLYPPNTPLVFSNGWEPKTHRFYRATDYSQTIQGTVRDILTDLPIAQATVTLADAFADTPNVTLQTDSQGAFHAVVPLERLIKSITVEKAGYELLTTKLASSSNLQLPLWLLPPGYRQPNDDFENALLIEGTNVAVRARTFGATSEPERPLRILELDIFRFFERDLWWSWTAPSDGAVLIQRQSTQVSSGSGMVVYTGEPPAELVNVWDTGFTFFDNAHNPFFVKQGAQYYITFGTVWPVDTSFTFQMVDPKPSVVEVGIAVDEVPIKKSGEELRLYSRVVGPRPLTYQWRKDGIEIPGATGAAFGKTSLGPDDTGAYSVQASNEAGAKISDEVYITVVDQIPPPLELIQGTWTIETSQGPVLITFMGSEFTAKGASDNTVTATGHFSIASWRRDRLRLEMTYTGSPEILHYINVFLTRLDTGTYVETDSKGVTFPHHQRGAFTRLSEP
jgi:hypothetical protein